MLISNAIIDDNQRLSMLLAAAFKADSGLRTKDLLSKTTYEDVASIIRSFDKSKNCTKQSRSSNVSLTAGSVNVPDIKGGKY